MAHEPAPATAAPTRTAWVPIGVICASEFVIWTSFSSIVPYLPVFLRQQGHSSVTMIGFVAAGFFLGTLLLSSPLGWLSDLIGRKPVMVGGMALFAVTTLLFTRTVDPRWFLVLRFFEGASAAAGGAMLAFVADSSRPEQRSRAYGFVTTTQFAGAIAGPALGALIYRVGGGGLPGFHAIFYFAAALAALATAGLALLIREPASTAQRKAARAGGKRRPPYRRILTPAILAFLAVGLTGNFALGGLETIWSIYLRDLGASMTTISLMWVAFSVPMLLSFAAGMLADRTSRFTLMFAGNTVAALGFLVLGLSTDISLFYVVSAVQGLAVAVATPAKQGLLIQVSPPRWIGTVTGLDQTSMQLGGLLGSLLIPVVFGAVSGKALIVCGVVSLVGLAVAAPALRRATSPNLPATTVPEETGAS